MIFRQLFDPQSSTYTYLLADAQRGEAILIDPVFEQARRDSALLHELELRLLATLDTHVHADHVTGAWLLKQLNQSAIVVSADSGATGADFLLHPANKTAHIIISVILIFRIIKVVKWRCKVKAVSIIFSA